MLATWAKQSPILSGEWTINEYGSMEDVDIIWMHQTETTNRAILTVIPPNDMLYEVTNQDQKSVQLHIYPKTDTVNVTL